MPLPKIVATRRAIAHLHPRTPAQVEAHIHARAGALHRRLALLQRARPTHAHMDARIVQHGDTLRMKHPEAPGT